MSTPVLQRFLRVHKLARPVRLRLALRLVVGAATLLAVLGFTRPVHAQTVPSIGGAVEPDLRLERADYLPNHMHRRK